MNGAGGRRPVVIAGITFAAIAWVGYSLASRSTTLEYTHARVAAEKTAATAADGLAAQWSALGAEAVLLAGALSNGDPQPLTSTEPYLSVDSQSPAYLFDDAGATVFPLESDLLGLPAREWRRLDTAADPGEVFTVGPFAVGQDPAQLFALTPVGGDATRGARRWIGLAISTDTLVARARFDDLGLAGYYYRLEQVDGGSRRLLHGTAVTELSEPVVVSRAALGSEFALRVAPAAGWWAVGLRTGSIALVLLLATLGGFFVYELARAPERAAGKIGRLDQRLREVQHLLRAESRKREKAEIRLRQGAKSDPLTGLPNRDRLMRALTRELRGRRADPDAAKAAVLALHVDRLSEVADSLGEDAADELLSEVARRLLGALRPGDIVARLSGERFAALLTGMQGAEAAHEAAQRVGEALDQPVRVRRHEIYTSVSVGLSHVATGMETAEDLLREAETALHEARRIGRGRLVSFDRSLREVAAQSLLLRSDLRPALDEGQFALAFQPIVSLESGHAPFGMEVLVRWNHPREGLITPGLFIPIAEEDGFVVRLSRWISQRAVDRYLEWKSAGLLPEGFYFSLNISGRELHQPDICDYYERLVTEHQLPEGAFRLEVTERILTDDVDLAARNLERLRSFGVMLMLDDFGTGYSSLSYLHQFRFDTLKIDQSFVMRALDSQREQDMLAAIVQLAESLDMKTVAEGIEEPDIVPILQTIGCSSGQGYLFARPLFTEDAEQYLRSAIEAGGGSAQTASHRRVLR